MEPIDFHSTFFHTMEVNGVHQLLLQNAIFCVQQKDEIHTGLKKLEGE